MIGFQIMLTIGVIMIKRVRNYLSMADSSLVIPIVIGTLLASMFLIPWITMGAKADNRIPQESVSVKIHGDINEGSFYNLEDAVVKAGTGGTVYIDIDSNGGSVLAEYAMLNTLKAHKIHSICSVGDSKKAFSAAAILLINCSEIKVEDTALIIFHLPFFIVQEGDEQFAVRTLEGNERSLNWGMDVLLKKVLGAKQYQKYLLGGDVFISGNQLKHNLGL